MPTDYSINLDLKFAPLETVDIISVIAACREKWFNQSLTRVNDCVVRVGILEGEFHWHKHDLEDEFFLTLQGELLVDLEDRTVCLSSLQGIMVPRGVLHRTRAPEKVVVLMIEGAGVTPTGD